MKQRKNVLVLGATGFTGQKVVRQLVAEGHHVTALVRSAFSSLDHHDSLTVVPGDVFDRTLLTPLIAEQDAVISCLGVGGLGDGKPNDFVSRATQGIIQTMEEVGVRRLVVMSNVGAGDSKAYMGWFATRVVIPFFLMKLIPIIEDKNVMEASLTASSLDFTAVRFPNITGRSVRGRVTATTTGKGLKQNVTVHDAATFLADQLASDRFVRQFPSVSN